MTNSRETAQGQAQVSTLRQWASTADGATALTPAPVEVDPGDEGGVHYNHRRHKAGQRLVSDPVVAAQAAPVGTLGRRRGNR